MSFRRAVAAACGLAGGSALLLCAAESREYFGDNRGGRSKAGVGVLHAAHPSPWAPGNHSVQPSGYGWDNNWDKRDPTSNPRRKERSKEENSSEAENSKPTATRHIFLIRHSQYNLNGNRDQEKTLTPLGREQAELTGQRLAALGLQYDVLIHSSMARATETANIISRYLPGENRTVVTTQLPSELLTQTSTITNQYHEDGARIEAAFRRYIHRAEPKQKEDSYEIIVCHANVIRYFVCRALQFPPEGWLRLGLNNGSITWLTIRPSGRVALRALGDSGFMPPDKVTRT
ncbi:hypothetical protein P4O66_005420 [Electrophorus voltai]|uniref:Serine/threonine-protein phosphatase PGAM5, mitochondrial n=1 Tax=Electrophorus voltai TaxID=2609070 RepID=A0AAD8ZX37_9TELE|nr:hypothetical protein P4O66_005420 [Electrophorus voltai]